MYTPPTLLPKQEMEDINHRCIISVPYAAWTRPAPDLQSHGTSNLYFSGSLFGANRGPVGGSGRGGSLPGVPDAFSQKSPPGRQKRADWECSKVCRNDPTEEARQWPVGSKRPQFSAQGYISPRVLPYVAHMIATLFAYLHYRDSFTYPTRLAAPLSCLRTEANTPPPPLFHCACAPVKMFSCFVFRVLT